MNLVQIYVFVTGWLWGNLLLRSAHTYTKDVGGMALRLRLSFLQIWNLFNSILQEYMELVA